jgi:hypothetical protein
VRTSRNGCASAIVLLLLGACGGGSGGASGGGTTAPTPSASASPGSVYVAPAQEALTVADVQRILAQAAGEAEARGLPAVIAVTDRVGNVLAVYNMNGARSRTLISRLTATGVLNDRDVDLQGT